MKNAINMVATSIFSAGARNCASLSRRDHPSFIDMIFGSGTIVQLAKNVALGLMNKVTVLMEGALRLKPARVMQCFQNYPENALSLLRPLACGFEGNESCCNEWSVSHR
jgi:hypothetical protein